MTARSTETWAFGPSGFPRRRGLRAALTAITTVMFTLATIGIAWADNTVGDGDGLTPVANNNMALGDVCAGAPSSKAALVAVSRNGAAGSTNVFKDGSTVTVSVLSVSGSGLTATMNSSPSQITLPSNWGTQANNTMSGAVPATVVLNTSTLGAFSGSVTFRGAGINSSDAAIDRDDVMNVTANVTNCTPADTTPPVITKTVSGTLGTGGWFTSDVTVTWTVTDAESAVVIDSGCGTQNFTSETTGTTSSCSAHSAGGSASDSVDIMIDKTGPSAALSVSGTLGSHGWYVSNVTVSTSGSDPASGGVTCTADQFQTADTTGTEFNGSCTNAAGLTTNAAPLTVKVDKTAPTIDFDITPAPNTEGWNKDNPTTVSYTCADATSGLDPNYGNDGGGCWNDDLAITQGLTSFVNRAVFDMAGNMASVSPSVKIDTDAPIINQGAINGTPGANGWYRSDVTVDFTASDTLSGLKHASDASFSLTASGEGASVPTDTRNVSDKADNVATAGPLTFMIDKGAPDVDCDTPSSAWSATDIVVNCTAEDGVSGLADLGDAAFTLSTNVAAGTETDSASTGSRDVCDVSGQCTTVGPFTGLKVDKKAPEVSCGSADSVWHATNQSVGCTATDGGSGVVDGSFTLWTSVASGTETDGAYTDSDSAFDAVGNSSAVGPVGPFKIDRKAPEVSCGSADSVWHADDVSILCGAMDLGSGPLVDSAFLSTGVPAGTEDPNASTGTHDFCDDVDNCTTAGPVSGNKVDKKGPSITITTPGSGASFLLNQAATSDFACADGGSGLDTCEGPATVTTSTVGSHGFTVDATDLVGNPSTLTHQYSVTYATGACLGQLGRQVLQPVNANGSSVFKRGSTVPVKFRVCDANGASIGTPGVVAGTGAPVFVSKSSGAGAVDEAVYSTTPDTAFRWSATDQQWIYNQNTKNLVAGVTYTYRIPLNDGTEILYTFGVK